VSTFFLKLILSNIVILGKNETFRLSL
jgi:hypothetical protein